MPDITIRRVQTRLRIPSDAMAERTRLKRAIAAAFNNFLEPALERRGISPHGYLCIRQLHATIRIRLVDSNSQLAEAVAQNIADAIGSAQNDRSSVYYSSRSHILIDIAAAGMRRDLSRSWAWAQLGLWHKAGSSADAAAAQVMNALVHEPRHAVPVLAYLASDGATIPALLRLATPSSWSQLAVAVCHEHGASVDLAPTNRGGLFLDRVSVTGSSIVHNSSIAKALMRLNFGLLSDAMLAAFAALIIVEVEPAALRVGGNAPGALLDSVTKNLTRAVHFRHESTGSSSAHNIQLETEQRSVGGDDFAEEESPRNDTRARAHHQHRSGHDISQDLHSSQGNDYAGASPFDGRASSTNQTSLFEAERSEQPLSQVQQAATTSYGGLLYLLNVASMIDLAASTMRDPGLTVRGLRWSLHRLALSLLPICPDDPAALAFAGLLPDNSPPPRDQDITDGEKIAIEECRCMLVTALREVIQDCTELAEMSDTALIDFVCHRRAQVCGDPGWIEIHLRQNEVSTELRKAGLDLDPGWLPWLGVVVKFIYV